MKWPTLALAAALGLSVTTPALGAAASKAADAQPRISLNYRGPLSEAVKRIADDAKLSVVVRGNFQEAGDFHFENVPAEEALETLAAAYGLTLEHHGSVFTLRPPSPAELAQKSAPRAALAALPPLPPVPPSPPSPPSPSVGSKGQASDEEADSDSDSDSESQADDEQQAAEDRRQAAEERKQAASERRTELRDRLREMKEKLRGLPHHPSNECDVSVTGNYTVEEGQEACDVVVFGGNLDVLGRVTGDVAVYGGNVHVGSDAEVQGDVVAFGGEVHVDEGAEVHGEQMSFGGSSGNGVMTKGAKAWRNVTNAHTESSSGSSLGWSIPRFLLKFAAFFGLSFIFLMFVPARMKQIEAEVKREPVKCAVAGLVGSVALVPLSIMLAVLVIIGWPFLVVLWLLVLLGVGMGATTIAAEIGTRLPVLKSTRKTQAAVLAVGIGVLLLAELIPYLGPLSLVVVAMVSLGAVIRTRFGGKPQGYPTPI
ncbi:MAG: polymer-forming cytoskeletal protein [Myxococcaceae bacterium]